MWMSHSEIHSVIQSFLFYCHSYLYPWYNVWFQGDPQRIIANKNISSTKINLNKVMSSRLKPAAELYNSSNNKVKYLLHNSNCIRVTMTTSSIIIRVRRYWFIMVKLVFLLFTIILLHDLQWINITKKYYAFVFATLNHKDEFFTNIYT